MLFENTCLVAQRVATSSNGQQVIPVRIVDHQPPSAVLLLEASSFDGETLQGQDTMRVPEAKAAHPPRTTRWPGTVTPAP